MAAPVTTRDGQVTAQHAGPVTGSLEDFAYKGNLAEVKRMLERGAQVDCIDTAEGGYGWSAVNSAAAAGHKQVVELLVRKRADLEATNSYGHTALHSAAARGHIHVVRYLTEIDEDYWKGTDEFKQWAKGEGKSRPFEDSGFWIATTDYLNKKSTGKKPCTAAELAHALDHDFVQEFLDEQADELSLVEQRRGGTNKRAE